MLHTTNITVPGTPRPLVQLLALLALLTGCQSTQPTSIPEPVACITPEPVECPVCEVTQCPAPEVIEKEVIRYLPAPEVAAPVKPKAEKPTIGALEWVRVEPSELVMEARIDTGAETSSIHAEDITLLEKDGKRWVRFSLINPKTGEKVPVERRLHRRIVVKQQDGSDDDRRFVVRMYLTMDDVRSRVDVSLSDREDFEYPLLIGRNMLMDFFSVDVSKRHTLPKPK